MNDHMIPGTIRKTKRGQPWVVVDELTWRYFEYPDRATKCVTSDVLKNDISEIIGRLPPHRMDASCWDDIFKLPDGHTGECEWTDVGWVVAESARKRERSGWIELEPGVIFFHPNPRRPEECGELVALPRKGPRGVLNEHGVPFRRLRMFESSTFVLKNSLIKQAVVVGRLHPNRMTATEMTDEFKLPKGYDPHRDDLYFNPNINIKRWEYALGGWLENSIPGRRAMKKERGWVVSHAWNPLGADRDDDVEKKSEDPERKWSWRGFTIYQNANGSFDARNSEGKLVIGHGGCLPRLLDHIYAASIGSYVDEREKQLQFQIEDLKNQIATYKRHAVDLRTNTDELIVSWRGFDIIKKVSNGGKCEHFVAETVGARMSDFDLSNVLEMVESYTRPQPEETVQPTGKFAKLAAVIKKWW